MATTQDYIVLGMVTSLALITSAMAGSALLVTGFMEGWNTITMGQWSILCIPAVCWGIVIWVRSWSFFHEPTTSKRTATK